MRSTSPTSSTKLFDWRYRRCARAQALARVRSRPLLPSVSTRRRSTRLLLRSNGRPADSCSTRLIADQLEATSGKIDFASVGALPAGLDEIYAENFRRVFVDDGTWGDALPLVELICAAAEPLTMDAARVGPRLIERGARRSVTGRTSLPRCAGATSLACCRNRRLRTR